MTRTQKVLIALPAVVLLGFAFYVRIPPGEGPGLPSPPTGAVEPGRPPAESGDQFVPPAPDEVQSAPDPVKTTIRAPLDALLDRATLLSESHRPMAPNRILRYRIWETDGTYPFIRTEESLAGDGTVHSRVAMVADHVLVQLDSPEPDPAIIKLLRASGLELFESVTDRGLYKAAFNGLRDPDRMAVIMKTVAKLVPSLEFVEPDYLVFPDRVPNDAKFSDGTLWGLRNTGQQGGAAGVDIVAEHAWNTTTGSANVIVAVIDSGIRYTHQDLATQMWRNPNEIAGNGIDDDNNGFTDDRFGINAIENSGDPMDDDGHGTHAAGTIGADANNGHPHVGVAWNVRLMALKFLSSEGGGTTSDAIECINYAVANGANILNTSWGGEGNSSGLRNAILAAGDAGVLVVAATGNDGVDNDTFPHYPSSFDLDNIIAVTSIDRRGNRHSNANYGRVSVDIGAPGVSIYSTSASSDSAYETHTGTSVAAPYVTGVAALVRSAFPGISLGDLRDRLLETTTATPDLQGVTVCGGRINAHRALSASGDGQLDLRVMPPSGTTMYYGQAQSVGVRVTDLTGITGANVTGSINGGGSVVFHDDGKAPDTKANDSLYTATIVVPTSWSGLELSITASAPGKMSASELFVYPLDAPPPNDHFDDRLTVEFIDRSTTANNVGATLEPGEPRLADEDGGASVWWAWTVPADAIVTVSTEGSDFDTLLGVFTGDRVDALTEIASNDDISGPNQPSKVEFKVDAGTNLQIAVDGWSGQTGRIVLTISVAVCPPNDRFANRIKLSGTPASSSGTLANATFETGEPDHQEFPRTGSIWWEWTAPSTGTATLTHTGWSMSAVYTGTALSELTPVPGRFSDDVLGYRTFPVTAGNTYQIAIIETTNGPGQTTTIELNVVPAPANDFFANRIELAGTQATASGTNVNATREPGESQIMEYAGGATVWWTWTAPASGTVIIDTIGSDYDTVIGAYTGVSLKELELVAANHNASNHGNTSRVEFSTKEGTTYQIAVDGSHTSTGPVSLSISLVDAPANDRFDSRTAITGDSAELPGSHVGATREEDEPGFGRGVSVWWTWTAPRSGTATVQAIERDLPLQVYTGSRLEELVAIPNSASYSTPVIFHAEGGESYAISVESDHNGSPGAFTLQLSLVDGPANDMFADRTTLTGTSITVASSTNLATIETDEPTANYSGGGGSTVWWSWTAPSDGTVILDTLDGRITPVRVYTGSTLPELTHVVGTGTYGHFVFMATAGTTYAIAANRYVRKTSDFTLKLKLVTPPANDHFADRESITGSTAHITASNLGATREPDETDPYGGSTSVWWSWRAPHNGTATITTEGSAIETSLSVYTGGSLGGLDTVRNDSQSVDFSRVVFHAIAGMTYQIVVNGRDAGMGEVVLNLSLDTPPLNDLFSNRTAIAETSTSVTGTNLGATREDSEPIHAYYNRDGASVWWTWTAPETGSIVVSADRSSIAPIVTIYTGSSISDLTLVAQGAGNRHERAVFRAVAGTGYQIAVEGENGATGDITLDLTFQPAPPNDDFSNRSVVSGIPVTIDGTTVGATREDDDPAIGPHYGLQATVWWTWTAPASGALIASIEGDDTALDFDLFSGSSIDGLTPETWNHYTDPNGKSKRAYDVIAGRNYQIVVGSNNANARDFRLLMEFRSPLAHDNFADRSSLDGTEISLGGSNLGASREAGEPYVGGYTAGTSSVWWSWIAPFTGTARIDIRSTEFHALVGVFTGQALQELEPAFNSSSSNNGQNYVFSAVAGTTYQIVAFSGAGPGGRFELSLSLVEGQPNDMFADRISITGTSARMVGSSRNATIEEGEPAEFFSRNSTVWWTWTAPANGKAVIAFLGDHYGGTLRIFTGSKIDSLAMVDTSYLGYVGDRLVFNAIAGTAYQIGVSEREDDFILGLDLVELPANDSFAGRATIVGTSVSFTGSNLAAGAESEEPRHHYQEAMASVWWEWTAPTDGRVSIDKSRTSFHSVIGVHTGTRLNNLSPVQVESRPWIEFGEKAVLFDVYGGTTYFIAVDGYSGEMGDIDMHLSLHHPPPNDAFGYRTAIPADTGVVQGTNIAATIEPAEPHIDIGTSSGSVWWSWTAPTTAPVIVSTEGSDFDTLLAVYTGGILETLTLVDRNQDDPRGGTTSRLVFTAAAGRPYQILVDGFAGDFGSITLSVEIGKPPVANVQTPAPTVDAGNQVVLETSVDGTGPFSYQWRLNDVPIEGATGSSFRIPSAQLFHAGSYSVSVDGEFGNMISDPAALVIEKPEPSDARLLNLSTRALCLTGNDVLIPGFTVSGTEPMRLLIRGVGAKLADFGLNGVLENPRLVLKRLSGTSSLVVAENDDWSSGVNPGEIASIAPAVGAFPLDPGSRDAALALDLEPGNYTVITTGADNGTGLSIVELYDANADRGAEGSRMINISTRGYVGSGSHVMIPGFVVSDAGAKTLLLRAVGPGLTNFGVPGALQDPELIVFTADPETGINEQILINNDWDEYGDAAETAAAAEQVGAFPLAEGSKDSAFVIVLQPGVYTVRALGADGNKGVALVEIYEVP